MSRQFPFVGSKGCCRDVAIALAAVCIGLAALSGCSSDPQGDTGSAAKPPGNATAIDPSQLVLETDVGDADPRAGIAFQLKCRTFKRAPAGSPPEAYGDEVALPAAATVVVIDGPAEPLDITGTTLRLSRVGTWHVACALPSVHLTDATPAAVQVASGPPHVIDTFLPLTAKGQPLSEVVAGTPVAVTCTAADSYGNDITSGFSLDIDPAPQPKPGGTTVTLKKVGSYQIACQVEGVADTTPVTLTVGVDVPRHLFTVLDPDTIEAGHAAQLTCVANDAFGNAVADFPFSLDNDPELTVKGLYVTATKTGLRKVQCVPESLAWNLFILHPATLTVLPGPPATLELTPVPAKPVYKNEEKVQFLAAVRDAFGNLVPAAKISLDVTNPAKGWKKLADDLIRFNVDGTFTVHGEVQSAPEVVKDLAIVVDGTPPLLTIDSPPWGSTLDGKPSIQLKGIAGDNGAGLKSLKVSKTSHFVDPVPKNAFASAVPCLTDADCKDGGTCAGNDPENPRCSVSPWVSQAAAQHGLNAVRADAEDMGGEKAKATRGFYYSGKYRPADAAQPLANLIADGMQVFLGKDFLDDGVHDPSHPDDLATIIEMALAALDVASLLPPAVSSGGIDVKLSNTKFGKPTVSLVPQAGGMDMKVVIPNVYTDIDVKAKQKLGPISITLHVSGNITIDEVKIFTSVAMAVVAGQASVAVNASSVDLKNMKLHVDGLAGLFDPLFNLLLGTFKGELQKTAAAQLNSMIPKLLQGLLQQFAINQTLPLPGLLPGMPAVSIQLISVLKTLQFTTKGGLLLLDAGFVAPKNVSHTILGAIGRDGCIATAQDAFAIDYAQRLQFALHDDVLNQMLYAVWFSGALQFPATGLDKLGLASGTNFNGFSLEGATLALDMFLPPIIETCNQPSPSKVRVQVGDLSATVSLKLGDDALALGVFASVDIGAQIDLAQSATGTQLALSLDKQPNLMIELVSISKDFQDQKAVFEKLLMDQLNAQLANGLPGLDKLAIDLPSLDLGALLPGLPVGAKIGLKIKDLKRSGGYTAISALLD